METFTSLRERERPKKIEERKQLETFTGLRERNPKR